MDLETTFLHHVTESQAKFVQMGQESQTRYSYQSEQANTLQSKVRLAPNGMENQTFDHKIQI